jgi:hypothetical protein
MKVGQKIRVVPNEKQKVTNIEYLVTKAVRYEDIKFSL